MDTELKIKDIDILIESLDAWECKDTAGDMMSELMIMMLLPKNVSELDKAKFEDNRDADRKKAELEKRERRETALLLKAKLVMLKQEIPVKDANEILKKN